MGLLNIKKRSETLGKKNLKTLLQVNKFDDPRSAMELIGHICTAAKDVDFTDEFTPIWELLSEMEKFREEQKFKWKDDLFGNLLDILDEIENTFLDNTYQLKIAVSGGYSAGKSTFMNMLIGEDEFLPTDMNPTSLVNTYINFNNKIAKPVVRGENIKNNLVLLNEDVLASIRHDTQNAKAVANVLHRMIIDVPCKNFLDEITFIDTPGYDNSLTVNRENGKTDKDTASKAFKEAKVIFWCANIGKQVTEEDLNFIRENGGEDKPVVILLSRMKSKTLSEVPLIAKSCYNTATKSLKNVIDVIAFDKEVPLDGIYSYKRNALSSLFGKIKEAYNTTVLELYEDRIKSCFDEEQSKSKEWQNILQSERNDVVSKLNEARKNSSSLREINRDWNKDLQTILIDGYNEVLEAADNLADSSSYAIDKFLSFYNGVMDFENNDHWGSSSVLNRALASGRYTYEQACNKHNEAIKYQYHGEEWRKEVFNHFVAVSNAYSEQDPYDVDNYEKRKSELFVGMMAEKKLQQCTAKYQPMVLAELQKVNDKCIEKRKKHYQNLEKLEKIEERDIFSAITGGNMNRFILCFHTGVELTTCNSQGYNVLTWTVTCGNTEMLEFLLKHKDDKEGIDMTIKDKNGLNIMEASVVAHNKQACRLLLKSIPSLRQSGKQMDNLADKNDFKSWIKTL